MLGRIAVVVVAMAGCNRVLGLDPTRPEPDAPPPVDAPPDGPCSTVTMPAVADGSLLQNDPTLPENVGSLANISATNLVMRGLFRFDVANAPSSWYSLTLVLPFVQHDAACGAPCGSCATTTLEVGGAFHVFPATSDWDEQTSMELGFTWNCRRGPSSCAMVDRWEVPGASGTTTDHGPEVGAPVVHVAHQDTQVSIRGAEAMMVKNWVQGDHLSLLVIADPGTAAIVRTHEHTCDPGAPAATLAVTTCP